MVNSGVVHQNVYPPEFLNNLVDHLVGRVFVADVRANGKDVDTKRTNGFADCFGLIRAFVIAHRD